MANQKENFIETGMQVIAENGISLFSIKEVVKRAGHSDALLYKHFETKENYLWECFMTAHNGMKGVMAAIRKIGEDEARSRGTEDSVEFAVSVFHEMWLNLVRYLVKNDYQTVFYYEYRSSAYYLKELENHEGFDPFFTGSSMAYALITAHADEEAKRDADFLWRYILTVTELFAKRIIRGETDSSEKNYERMWSILEAAIVQLLTRIHEAYEASLKE